MTDTKLGNKFNEIGNVPVERRKFSDAYKRKFVKDCDAARSTPGGIKALLDENGIWSSTLTTWRRQFGRQAKVDIAISELKRQDAMVASLRDAAKKASADNGSSWTMGSMVAIPAIFTPGPPSPVPDASEKEISRLNEKIGRLEQIVLGFIHRDYLAAINKA